MVRTVVNDVETRSVFADSSQFSAAASFGQFVSRNTEQVEDPNNEVLQFLTAIHIPSASADEIGPDQPIAVPVSLCFRHMFTIDDQRGFCEDFILVFVQPANARGSGMVSGRTDERYSATPLLPRHVREIFGESHHRCDSGSVIKRAVEESVEVSLNVDVFVGRTRQDSPDCSGL